MKDLFVGIAIGAVAGAMLTCNPKAQKMMNDVKSKMSPASGAQSGAQGSGSCGCGGAESSDAQQGGNTQDWQ